MSAAQQQAVPRKVPGRRELRRRLERGKELLRARLARRPVPRVCDAGVSMSSWRSRSTRGSAGFVIDAVEGLKLATPAFDHVVVPVTVIILVALFAVQSRGQCRQRAVTAQFRVSSTGDELLGLHEKLDLTNPTGPQLDVALRMATVNAADTLNFGAGKNLGLVEKGRFADIFKI